MKWDVRGSIVALVTPMRSEYNADGDSHDLDVKAFSRLIEWHVHAGTQGILLAGTTGEGHSLTTDELQTLIKAAVNTVPADYPVLVGTGTSNTRTTILRTSTAAKCGASACLVVTPYYVRPTQVGMYDHFKAVAEANPNTSIILYNVPSRTGCDLLPATVQRLSAISNIVGIKEATSDNGERIRALRAVCPRPFLIYSGNDASCARDILSNEADGVISVTANLVPSAMGDMCKFALEKDRESAEKIDSLLQKAHSALFVEPNPTPIKFALSEVGRIQEGIRLPLRVLSSEHQELVKCACKEAMLVPSHESNYED